MAYCPPIRHTDWNDPESEIQHTTKEIEQIQWEHDLIDYAGASWGLRADLAETRRRLVRSKARRLKVSGVLSFLLCLLSLVFGLGDVLGLLNVLHPFFWFP